MNELWQKRGLIFDPSYRFDWMNAYSQVPTILEKENVLRIYFTCRPIPDRSGLFVSHIAYIDVDKNDPSNVLYIHPKPILDLGNLGAFDEFGIHPTGVIRIDEKVYLYYTGWMRGVSVPYETWIGLAISNDDGDTFFRYSEGPIIGKSTDNPYLANGAFVFDDESHFKMMYASTTAWVPENGKHEPVYTLKGAVSSDGIHWETQQKPLFQQIKKDECISRPTVIRYKQVYHTWYGYRKIENFRGGSNSYRIGYATSKDFINWERNDELAGISLSKDDWDSQMMSYPQVLQIGQQLIMFYNGNHFGKYGFGYAVMDIGLLV